MVIDFQKNIKIKINDIKYLVENVITKMLALSNLFAEYSLSNIPIFVDKGADIINFRWVTTYDSPALRGLILNSLNSLNS